MLSWKLSLDNVCRAADYAVMETFAEVVSTAVAAEMLGVPLSTLHNWIDRDLLKPVFQAPGKRGAFMFNRSDVEALAAGVAEDGAA